MAEQTTITLIHPLSGDVVLLDTQTGRIMPEQTTVPPGSGKVSAAISNNPYKNALEDTLAPVTATQEPWHVAKAREVYRTIEAFGWHVTWNSPNPVPDDAWPVDIIARALLDAQR